MIEHEAHVGTTFQEGLSGHKIAIVGYSHWGDLEKDEASYTKDCIHNVMENIWKIGFFTQIKNYFGYEDRKEFWNRVMFFNFLPNCVGGPDARYNDGSPEQIRLGRERFMRLIWRERPDKVIVFTSKWKRLPKDDTTEGVLEHPALSAFRVRTFHKNGMEIPAYLLRHPQGANGEVMRTAIQEILSFPRS